MVQVRQNLLAEINTLLGLSHPHLVRLRCIGAKEVRGRLVPGFVAMDFCGEGTLGKWIAGGLVSDALAPAFVADLVSALTYLHLEKRLLHRDLKPENIFVSRRVAGCAARPALVVGDVGVSKQVAHTQAQASIAGTPMYVAPEVLLSRGQAATSMASDVYSASLVAVEIVTCANVYEVRGLTVCECMPRVPRALKGCHAWHGCVGTSQSRLCGCPVLSCPVLT